MGCVICERVFGPKAFNGVRELRTFKGYTVDFKLKEFRRVPTETPPEFIDFDSPEGRRLLVGMHHIATELLNRKFAKLA